MDTRLKGIHHITLCPGGAQEDVDFFTTVLGLRLVKQTVLMDGSIPIYHFYYGNADADPGSILTCFPYGRRPGRVAPGRSASRATRSRRARPRSGPTHFDRTASNTPASRSASARARFGVTHPAGLLLEVVENPGDPRRPWTTPEISADVAIRGFFGAVMSVQDVEEQERSSVHALGFRKVGVEGACHRFEIPDGGPDRTIELLHEPGRPQGSWTFGAGTAHHIAFNVETDEALVEQKAMYEELGYTDTSEVKDRFYFHSMYVRSPGRRAGGVHGQRARRLLCGRAAGGTRHAPEPAPWYEDQRDVILSQLEPVTVPEANRPKAGAPRGIKPLAVPEPPAHIALSRTNAEFSKRH